MVGTRRNPLSSLTYVPYGPAAKLPIGVTALAVILTEIVDSCLHHLQAILIWLRDGSWLSAYSHYQETEASTVAHSLVNRFC